MQSKPAQQNGAVASPSSLGRPQIAPVAPQQVRSLLLALKATSQMLCASRHWLLNYHRRRHSEKAGCPVLLATLAFSPSCARLAPTFTAHATATATAPVRLPPPPPRRTAAARRAGHGGVSGGALHAPPLSLPHWGWFYRRPHRPRRPDTAQDPRRGGRGVGVSGAGCQGDGHRVMGGLLAVLSACILLRSHSRFRLTDKLIA